MSQTVSKCNVIQKVSDKQNVAHSILRKSLEARRFCQTSGSPSNGLESLSSPLPSFRTCGSPRSHRDYQLHRVVLAQAFADRCRKTHRHLHRTACRIHVPARFGSHDSRRRCNLRRPTIRRGVADHWGDIVPCPRFDEHSRPKRHSRSDIPEPERGSERRLHQSSRSRGPRPTHGRRSRKWRKGRARYGH